MIYFVTFTTYGTHLPGDERGSTNRHLGTLPRLSALEAYARSAMAEEPFQMELPEERQTVANAIQQITTKRNWCLLALHVRTNHVHGVVQAQGISEKIMGDWKSSSSRELKLHWPTRQRFWTRNGHTRTLTGEAVNRAIAYVLEQQGKPMTSFDDRSATPAHSEAVGSEPEGSHS